MQEMPLVYKRNDMSVVSVPFAKYITNDMYKQRLYM